MSHLLPFFSPRKSPSSALHSPRGDLALPRDRRKLDAVRTGNLAAPRISAVSLQSHYYGGRNPSGMASFWGALCSEPGSRRRPSDPVRHAERRVKGQEPGKSHVLSKAAGSGHIGVGGSRQCLLKHWLGLSMGSAARCWLFDLLASPLTTQRLGLLI